MSEVAKFVQIIGKPKPKRTDRNDGGLPLESEAAVALQFVEKHGDEFKYCHDSSSWVGYSGGLWSEDRLGVVRDAARVICESVAAACPDIKTARTVASSKQIRGVLQLASAWRGLSVRAEDFDRDPWLLNTPDCVIDLRSGEKMAHSADLMMSKRTAVTPGGAAPLFTAMLQRITGGDIELQEYLRRAAGYQATGSTREHAMFFLFGGGANGKSTFLNAISGALGNYATVAPMDLFLEQHGESHPTGIAGLEGARLVTATETDEGSDG